MLLEFKAKNFKTFKEELLFSMIPAPKQKGLDYSILHQKIGAKNYKSLCSSVIYGPNAAGKTNIIGAMEVLKSIVLKGNILNTDEKKIPNAAVNTLELIPNNTNMESNPVEFSIKFIEGDLLIQYDLAISIGKFLDADFDRKIIFEKLVVNEKMIFERAENLIFGSIKILKNYLINEFEENEKGAIALAKNNLNPKELFLTNGFKAMFSGKFVNLLTSWFDKKFKVIYRANDLQIKQKIKDPQKQTAYCESTINIAARMFGANTNEIGYIIPEDGEDAKLCSIFKDKQTAISAEFFESYGTIRFVNLFPLIIEAILKGGTLVIDEFDASIHPMALMSIINIFHNDDINKKGAQLIFNTHNPIFLNSNLFRRDEIKFVERDELTDQSRHYSLSDFGTTGDKGVRKHEDYMDKYFVSQYGAIKDVDFTSIFESLLEKSKEGTISEE